MNHRLAVVYRTENEKQKAVVLSKQLGCATSRDSNAHEFNLIQGSTGLYLTWSKYPKSVFQADFTKGMVANLLRGQAAVPMLAKACGIKKDKSLTVLDVTAGWGEDGVSLAALGAQVTLLERHPLMAALLQDALAYAADQCDRFAQLNIKSIAVDALDYMQALSEGHCPDVIYCDPMFEPLRQHALVKKEMQLLRALFTEEDHQDDKRDEVLPLLESALMVARKRVVLKRHRQSPMVLSPSFSYKGKSTRYDIYLTTGRKA